VPEPWAWPADTPTRRHGNLDWYLITQEYPLCPRPDVNARRRGQDRSPNPPRCRRLQHVPHPWPSGRLRAWLRSPDAPERRFAASSPPAAATSTSSEPFLSASAALPCDPASRTYYDRKRAQGKKHNAALSCRARQTLRCAPRHAPKPRHLPNTATRSRLTRDIGTPPQGQAPAVANRTLLGLHE
jgi:hypothetical protein